MSSALSEMSLHDAIYGLRATRIYHDKPIPDAVLDEILEAATMACSSGNTQPWEFVVVTDPELKRQIQIEMKDAFAVIDRERAQTEEQLTDSSGRSVTGRAAVEHLDKVPAIVVVCWNPDRGIRMKNEYAENPDGTLRETREIPGGRGISLFQSCQNMMLAARAHGVSSLFTSFFFLKREEIKQILGIPPRIFMECAIFLGYADEKLGKPKRLPVPQVSHRNRWGTPYELSRESD
ncbi:MAG: nitroreductase family protein [Deltaproteobacteria bacterium]|jgi:nitroreductase|nr:nitroreductase family protein [Deltaproteobacteria bacterium]